MPYAPGIQDISGQLIAQGMSQAGAARARAIESIGESVAGGIKQYQQNQMFTNQALGKFGMGLQDPTFKQYVNQIVNDDPNAPQVPDALKKAFKNASAGKVDIYDAALLGTATEGYQQNRMRQAQMAAMQFEDDLRKAQTGKLIAETAGMGVPRGRIMTLDEFQKIPPSIDAKGRPVPGRPNEIELTEYNLRTPEQPKPPVVIPGDAITRVVDPKDPTKVLATYENIKVAPGQRLVGAGAAEGPSAPPASLPQFLPSGSMLGAAAQPAPSPVPAAALAAMAPAQAGLRIENIPGGPAAKEEAERARQEEAKSVRQLNSAQNVMRGIEMVERNLDKTFYGLEPVGMYAGARKSLSQAAVNVAQGIDTIVANIGFDELRSLKESGTSLGQVAIKELDNLQRLRGSLDQNLGKEEFKNTLAEFKKQAAATMERLDYLNKAYKSGATALTEPQLKEYQKLGGTGSPTATQKIQWSSGKEPGTGTLKVQSSFDAGKLQGADRQAYEWLLRNPNDPRANAIRSKLGL